MNRFLKHTILFLLPVLIGCVLLFMAPLDRGFAYHFVEGECSNQGSWIYDRIFENKKPIDIALIGASHVANGIDDQLLEERLSSLKGEPVNVANLGYCRGGRDIQYVMLKDLMSKKKPRIVVVEVGEDEPKKSHPVFPYLASNEDLFHSFVFFNQRYFSNLWKGLATRFEYIRMVILKRLPVYKTSSFDFGYQNSDQVALPEAIAENQARWEKRLKRNTLPIFRKIELNYSKLYLGKMIRLARENNCSLVFLYFPEFGSGMEKPFLNDYYEDITNLYLIPPDIISNPANWKDPSHFNDAGAVQTTVWFAGKLAE